MSRRLSLHSVTSHVAQRLVLVIFAATLGLSDVARATIWLDGEQITHLQTVWSDDPAVSTLLSNKFDTVYASTFGVFEVGLPGAAGFSAAFTSSTSLLLYLPTNGPPGALTSDLVDPTSSSASDFGGEVAALKLNVDFSDAGVTLGTSGIPFGNLILGNFNTLPLLNGLTVRELLGDVNGLLGGGSGIYSIEMLYPTVEQFNGAFEGGQASTFAQEHLAAPSIVTVPEPSTLALFGAGLAGLAALRRRRKAKE